MPMTETNETSVNWRGEIWAGFIRTKNWSSELDASRERLLLTRHLCSWKGEPIALTVTEFLILKSLAQRPGHVKNRNQLMDAAYGESIYVDDRTIDSHIKRLRKKFKAVDDDFVHIETLYGVGYRYKDA